jgi:hypothetical protein
MEKITSEIFSITSEIGFITSVIFSITSVIFSITSVIFSITSVIFSITSVIFCLSPTIFPKRPMAGTSPCLFFFCCYLGGDASRMCCPDAPQDIRCCRLPKNLSFSKKKHFSEKGIKNGMRTRLFRKTGEGNF